MKQRTKLLMDRTTPVTMSLSTVSNCLLMQTKKHIRLLSKQITRKNKRRRSMSSRTNLFRDPVIEETIFSMGLCLDSLIMRNHLRLFLQSPCRSMHLHIERNLRIKKQKGWILKSLTAIGTSSKTLRFRLCPLLRKLRKQWIAIRRKHQPSTRVSEKWTQPREVKRATTFVI